MVKFFKKIFFATIILIFSFQSLTKSDDVTSFELEGISIGNSLLDYFSEEEILKNKRNYGYKNKEFYAVGIDKQLEQYDSVDVHLKTSDKNYIIYSITGATFFEKNINECYKKKKSLTNELKSMFSNIELKQFKKNPMDVDKDSTKESTYFLFENGDYVKIQCYDWSEKITKEKNWIDHMRVGIAFREFRDWKRN